MTMTGNFVAVSAAQLQALVDDPSVMVEFLYPNDEAGEPPHQLNVDIAWHGIHFLLTGEAWGGAPPLGLAILGGREIGPDLAHGPARYLMPDEVKAVSQALAGLAGPQLTARYDPAAFEKAKIYPIEIWERDEPDALELLTTYFEELVMFYRDAAARGDGVLQHLT
jgi:hypothetical protein